MAGIGYQFWMSIGGVYMPYLTQGIEENHMMNVDDQSHTGHASTLQASEGVKAYAGSITANMSVLWAALFKEWVVTLRNTAKRVIIDTDDIGTTSKFTYSDVKVASGDLSSTAGEGNLVTLTVNVQANNYTDDTTTYQRTEAASTSPAGLVDLALNTHSPMPFYRSTIVATGGYSWDADQVLSWNLSISNGLITRYVHSGARVVRYIQAGPFSVTGSVTLYDDSATIPKPATGVRSVVVLSLAQSMAAGTGEFNAPTTYLTLPMVGYTTYDDAGAGRGDKKTRVVNFFGLGDGTNECVY